MITVTVALEQVWQGAKQLQKPLKILKNVGKTFSGTVNVIDKGFCKLSRTFSQVGLGLGWPEIALLPFTFWKLGKASVKVLSPSTSFLDRVSSTLDCTVLLDKLTLTAGFITKIVSAAGLAGRHAANWLNHFYPISAAISYVSCGLSLRTVYSAFKTFWAFRAIKNNLDNPA